MCEFSLSHPFTGFCSVSVFFALSCLFLLSFHISLYLKIVKFGELGLGLLNVMSEMSMWGKKIDPQTCKVQC